MSLKLNKATPASATIKPKTKRKESFLPSFRKMNVAIAVKIGAVEIMTLTFEAYEYERAMFSSNW